MADPASLAQVCSQSYSHRAVAEYERFTLFLHPCVFCEFYSVGNTVNFATTDRKRLTKTTNQNHCQLLKSASVSQ